MAEGYRIADEPRPGGLAHLAVSPMWPLFGVMFGGAALGWGWFALNSVALGCPYRRGAWKWIAGGLAGAVLLLLAGIQLLETRILPLGAGPYIAILLTVWKLGVSYKIYVIQSQTFAIYRHYGGHVRNGLVGVVVLHLLAPMLGGLPTFLELTLR